MRLSAEKIKQGFHHADAEVRTSVADYFGCSMSPDASVMPQVIEAIDKYDLDAFKFYLFLEKMIQTDEVMEWAIEKIKHVDLLGSWQENDFGDSLGQAILFADEAVLQRHAADLEETEEIDGLLREGIYLRMKFGQSDANALWQEFNDYCKQCEQDDDGCPDLIEQDRLLFAAMKRFPDQFRERIIDLLKGDASRPRKSMAIESAAELRLADAVPHLLNLLDNDDEADFGDIIRALARIDREVAAKEISIRFHGVETESRETLAVFLGLIHTDQSVQTCLQLSDEEEEDVVRAKLLQSVLMNFSTAGIEPARQFLLEAEKSPSVLNLRDALFVACEVMGETFPEFHAWQEDRKGDADFRQQWEEENDPFLLDLKEFDREGDEIDEDFDEDEYFDEVVAGDFENVVNDYDEQPAIPSATVVNEQPHVGRNDPCPCGSGKKFKKCCYRKVSD